MTRIILSSFKRHLTWWWASIWPGRHPDAPLHLRRWIFLLIAYPIFLAIQAGHWVGLLCDELFFPDYRKVEVKAPVFITGIPRSGTTFLHRTLAVDDSQFTTVSMWEALLAPSLTQRHIIRGFAALDRVFGSPVRRGVHWGMARRSGDFDKIHELGWRAPEEDYLFLLPAGGCFILLMAFPFSDSLSTLARLDAADPAERRQLLEFYRSCLQRHLYEHGSGRSLLSKNAAFATWSDALFEFFPDMRLLVCVRKPAAALSSQLSSLRPARQFFAADPGGNWTSRQFTEILKHSYAYLADFLATHANRPIAAIDHADLAAHPAACITRALGHAGIGTSAKLCEHIDSLEPHEGSRHRHSLPADDPEFDAFKRCTEPDYAAILQSSARVRPGSTPDA